MDCWMGGLMDLLRAEFIFEPPLCREFLCCRNDALT